MHMFSLKTLHDAQLKPTRVRAGVRKRQSGIGRPRQPVFRLTTVLQERQRAVQRGAFGQRIGVERGHLARVVALSCLVVQIGIAKCEGARRRELIQRRCAVYVHIQIDIGPLRTAPSCVKRRLADLVRQPGLLGPVRNTFEMQYLNPGSLSAEEIEAAGGISATPRDELISD